VEVAFRGRQDLRDRLAVSSAPFCKSKMQFAAQSQTIINVMVKEIIKDSFTIK
jgi:hypothetical protein